MKHTAIINNKYTNGKPIVLGSFEHETHARLAEYMTNKRLVQGESTRFVDDLILQCIHLKRLREGNFGIHNGTRLDPSMAKSLYGSNWRNDWCNSPNDQTKLL